MAARPGTSPAVLSYRGRILNGMNTSTTSKMMRVLFSVEVEITDETAVHAAGVSDVVDVDVDGSPADPYVPTGEFGLVSEIFGTVSQGGLPALKDRDGIRLISACVVRGQTAEGGKYPEIVVPAMPAAGF